MSWRLEWRLYWGSPASSESRDPANVNTSEEVFSIKVSNIWLHKHDTGCKNKAKELTLIASIKAVSLWTFGKWSYQQDQESFGVRCPCSQHPTVTPHCPLSWKAWRWAGHTLRPVGCYLLASNTPSFCSGKFRGLISERIIRCYQYHLQAIQGLLGVVVKAPRRPAFVSR